VPVLPCAQEQSRHLAAVGKGNSLGEEQEHLRYNCKPGFFSKQAASFTCKGCSHLTEKTAPLPLSFKASGSYGHLFSLFPGQLHAKRLVHDLTLLSMQNGNCSPSIFQVNLSRCRIVRPVITLL